MPFCLFQPQSVVADCQLRPTQTFLVKAVAAKRAAFSWSASSRMMAKLPPFCEQSCSPSSWVCGEPSSTK